MRNAGIGTKNESSLHKMLKFQYTGPGGLTEVETGEFVADGIRADGEYIEVQTGSFKPLIKKIKTLTANKKAKIRIIHPIAITKIIEVYSPISNKQGLKPKKNSASLRASAPLRDGLKLCYRRKSPKKGSLWSLFDALVHAPQIALLPGVTIEAVLADITEIRVKDGKGSWRRKGISIKDRCLTAWHETYVFKKTADYLRHFVPFKKNEEFTAKIFAERASINTDTSRQALYTLAKMGVVNRIGKQRRAWVYVIYLNPYKNQANNTI